jgi:hypothetical protein
MCECLIQTAEKRRWSCRSTISSGLMLPTVQPNPLLRFIAVVFQYTSIAKLMGHSNHVATRPSFLGPRPADECHFIYHPFKACPDLRVVTASAQDCDYLSYHDGRMTDVPARQTVWVQRRWRLPM